MKREARKTSKLSVPCRSWHITWDSEGYQCLNCGAKADHSWNIKHATQPDNNLYR